MKGKYLLVPILAASVTFSAGCANKINLLYTSLFKKNQPVETFGSANGDLTCEDFLGNIESLYEMKDCFDLTHDGIIVTKSGFEDDYDTIKRMRCSKEAKEKVESTHRTLVNRCTAEIRSQLEKTISCISEPAVTTKELHSLYECYDEKGVHTAGCGNPGCCVDVFGYKKEVQHDYWFTETRAPDCNGNMTIGGPQSLKNCYALASRIDDSIAGLNEGGLDIPKEVIETAFKAADEKCVNGMFEDVDKDYAGPSTRDNVIKKYRAELKPKFDALKASLKNTRKTQHR